MILGFRHRGLKQLFENDDHRKITPHHKDKISRILARLDEATQPQAMNLPGYRLYPLKGGGAETWYRLQATYEMAQALKRADRIKVKRLSPVG